MIAVVEVNQSCWLVGGVLPGIERQPRKKHQEFIRFLNAVEREVPVDKAVHVVLDNYASDKHPKVTTWLARHQRFTFHFTRLPAHGPMRSRACLPSSPAAPQTRCQLQAAINRFIAETNDKPSGPNPPAPSSPPCNAGDKR